jgi:hypothetical protein
LLSRVASNQEQDNKISLDKQPEVW